MLPEELMREVRLLELRAKRRVDDLFAGEYHSAFKGQGIEFAEVREYEPGDDVRSIDWNVTARCGRPFVKRYAEERQNTIMLALDRSATAWFGTRTRTKARLGAELTAVLAFAAAKNQDRVGMTIFRGEIEQYLPPRKGRGHTLRLIREALNDVPPEQLPKPTARKTGAGQAGSAAGDGLLSTLGHLRAVLHRRSIIFVMSDFLTELGDPLERALRRLTHRHDLTLVQISDPMETNPPAMGMVRVRDPQTGRARTVNMTRSTVRAFAAARSEHDAALRQMALRTGAGLLPVSTEGRYMDAVAAYLRTRAASGPVRAGTGATA